MNKLIKTAILLAVFCVHSNLNGQQYERLKIGLLFKNPEADLSLVKVLSGQAGIDLGSDGCIDYKIQTRKLLTNEAFSKKKLCVADSLKINGEYIAISMSLENKESKELTNEYVFFAEIVDEKYIVLDQALFNVVGIKAQPLTVKLCSNELPCKESARYHGISLDSIKALRESINN